MTIHERMGFMIFRVKIITLMNYMCDANVDREFVKTFGEFIDYLLDHDVHFSQILAERLPPFPPYRNKIFETKEECDEFCGVVKSWYGLDYKSKFLRSKRWRLVPC